LKNIDSLKNSREFREVYANGKSSANKLLVLYVLPKEGKRLGISVSKKIGNSVVRHRLTRLIRQSYVMLKDRIPEGYHLVVIGRISAAGKGCADIYRSLEQLCVSQNLFEL